MKVKLADNQISTDLYTKPTDRNTYLPYDSAHPKHCMRGLPYGQFLCIRRICSQDDDFEKHAARKAASLLQHGYPKNLLLDAMMRAYNKDRPSLLAQGETTPPQRENENIFLTTTYHRQYNGLRKQVESTWDLLSRSSTTRFLQSKTLKVGYRRPKNLRDILTRARLPVLTTEENAQEKTNETETPPPRSKCSNPRCRYCPRINKTGKIKSHTTGRMYTTRMNVDCTSNNLVYCISCKTCGKQYVGQTMNTVKKRFQSHFYLIKHKKDDHEISRHFNQHDHHLLDDVKIHILWFINHDAKKDYTKNLRLKYEFDWIHSLRTQIPLGLNTIDTEY